MPITIELSDADRGVLKARATKAGMTVEAYLSTVVARALHPKTLDEVLEPFRRSFDESGLTEAELDALVHEVREDIYQEQNGVKK